MAVLEERQRQTMDLCERQVADARCGLQTVGCCGAGEWHKAGWGLAYKGLACWLRHTCAMVGLKSMNLLAFSGG